METAFSSRLKPIMAELQTLLLDKNKRYGNSALNPIRIFSKANADEQILVRLDDKLSRIARSDYKDISDQEDTVIDLIGYLVILLIEIQTKKESQELNTEACKEAREGNQGNN